MRKLWHSRFGPALIVMLAILGIAFVGAGGLTAATDGYGVIRQASQAFAGLYTASPSTLATGEYDVVRLDSTGRLRVVDERSSSSLISNPVPVGVTNTVTVTVGSALPTGTNSIGAVTVAGGSVPVAVGVTNTVTVTRAAASTSSTATLATPNTYVALAAAAGQRLIGVSAREIAGTPAVATVSIYHGTSSSASTIIHEFELAADDSEYADFGPDGVSAANGIFIDAVAGSARVVLIYK